MTIDAELDFDCGPIGQGGQSIARHGHANPRETQVPQTPHGNALAAVIQYRDGNGVFWVGLDPNGIPAVEHLEQGLVQVSDLVDRLPEGNTANDALIDLS